MRRRRCRDPTTKHSTSAPARASIEARKMTDEANECIFCRVIRGDFGTEFVAESANAVAFHDLHPVAPCHVLIVPRRHVAALRDLGPADASLAGELLLLAARAAEQEGLRSEERRVGKEGGARWWGG